MEGNPVMRTVTRIAALTVAATAAAAGLAFTGAVPALAAVSPTTFVGGPQLSHAGCTVGLFYTRPSATTPPEAAAEIDSSAPGHTCTGFVERSPASGTAKWTVASAKVALPSVGGLSGVANTGLVYDGPGFKARACVQAAGSSNLTCTSSVSLGKGSGTATSPAFAASYTRRTAVVVRSSSPTVTDLCAGVLNSSATTKKAGVTVRALLVSQADPCTAWIQSRPASAATWKTVSPVVSFRSPNSNTPVLAFPAPVADGPGHLARLCVRDGTNKRTNCSGGW
jgi:hypothetical protein